MSRIFVNLKRFDVPRHLGGICPKDDPKDWIEETIRKSIELGLGSTTDSQVVYFLPESLILPAIHALQVFPESERRNLRIGCQGVFRDDIAPGGNFGAFTSNLPATAAKNMGATWCMIGHSEERKDKLGILAAYEPAIETGGESRARALGVVNELTNAEALRAVQAGLNVLFCLGETEEERGEGPFEIQKPRVEKALRSQVEVGLAGLDAYLENCAVAIGYEPIWAIGPGKTPPGAEYVDFVASFIKNTTQSVHGFVPPVVYGGGLKKENAAMMGEIGSLSGGLVALTKFTQPVGFDVGEFKTIVDTYNAAGDRR